MGQKVLSLPGLASKHVEQLNLDEVGLLASPIAIQEGLFEGNYKLVCLNAKGQAVTEKLIRAVVAGKIGDALDDFVEVFGRFSVPVILGCTELSVVNSKFGVVNVIDPLDLVVQRIFHD